MALPPPDHPCWNRLANGSLARLKTQHLGTQLMSKRIAQSSDPVNVKAELIRGFFAKWERALPAEVQQLPTL